jgi:hypothetical protein
LNEVDDFVDGRQPLPISPQKEVGSLALEERTRSAFGIRFCRAARRFDSGEYAVGGRCVAPLFLSNLTHRIRYRGPSGDVRWL